MDTDAIIDAVVSEAQALGLFDRVNQYEPKAPPGDGLTCAVWIEAIDPIQSSGLDSTSVRITMNVRLYTSMLAEPPAMIDPNLTRACAALMEAYTGDFTLDGLIRNVDLLGQHGLSLSAQAGYVQIGRDDARLMRVFTITLPLLINDAWQQVP